MTQHTSTYDVAVIGGGIVGVATAMALLKNRSISLVLLEAENRLAAHQTGHNSGVIHSGLYYQPGSLKAESCATGRKELYRFCEERRIPFEQCGKLVIAINEAEISTLDGLLERGIANGLAGLVRLGAQDLREYEPHATGVAGLWVPETGIVDFRAVTEACAAVVRQSGGVIRLGARVTRVRPDRDGLRLDTTDGRFHVGGLINCAGLQSDRVARMCGLDPKLHIVPFRGEYFELIASRRHLVRNLIYPVPDPTLPFLGVHFTRTIGGRVEAGPNAVLAFKRDGYGRFAVSPRDTLDWMTYGGFGKVARRYWRTGISEFHRSFSKRAFTKALRKLVPEVSPSDLRRSGAGIRAQAVDPDGSLVDDFRLIEVDRMIHVLNAPSPAATAGLAIGRRIADITLRRFSH